MSDDTPVVEEKKPTRSRRKKADAVVEATPAVVEEKDTAFDVFLDHEREALKSAGKAFESLIPSGIREHGEKALREMFEGYRVLFNSAIDDLIAQVERAKIQEKKEEDLN